jgi:hypothetical protein
MAKQDLKSAYNGFLNTEAGKDLLDQASKLEKAYVLLGIKATTNDEKAHALCRMEGVVALRDYIIRMSKP